MKSYRCERVADLITREVANILKTKTHDPRLQNITITATRITRDLRIADVYYILGTQIDDIQDVKKAIESAKGFIRRELGAVLKLRYIPELRFRYDQSLEDGNRIWDQLEMFKNEPLE
ncbi:MAG: 30S ribosome-binding factor RbfA [bacterium]